MLASPSRNVADMPAELAAFIETGRRRDIGTRAVIDERRDGAHVCTSILRMRRAK